MESIGTPMRAFGFLKRRQIIGKLNAFHLLQRVIWISLRTQFRDMRTVPFCTNLVVMSFDTLNPLKTKHRLLYLKTQFVPRSKHF